MTSSFTKGEPKFTKEERDEIMARAAKQEPPSPTQEAFGDDFSKSLRQINIDDMIRQELACENTSDWTEWQLRLWIYKKRNDYGF